jgi:hypothetical protein
MLRKILSLGSNYNYYNDFYKTKVNWTNQFVNDNISSIVKNYEKFPNRNRWNCNVHTTHMGDDDVYPVDFQFLRNEYTKVAKKFCKSKGRLPDRVYLPDVWYNYYEEGQFQEPHNHEEHPRETNIYVLVHYMIFDKSCHEPTKFCDIKLKPPEVECGDILIFPSRYWHFVPPNITKSPRLTFSCNIVLD